MQDLIASWRRLFGEQPVHPREVLESSLQDASLARALAGIPGLTASPQPVTLSRWLSTQENLPFDGYRFSRAGHRWRLAKALQFGTVIPARPAAVA
jgi:hypothetical protein